MKPTPLAASLLVGLLASQPAHAWRHTFFGWSNDSFPIEYWVADDGNDGEIGACFNQAQDLISACCEESVPGGYCAEAAQLAFDAWDSTGCAEISSTYMGNTANTPFQADGQHTISFNDPGEALGLTSQIVEPGTLAVTRTSNTTGRVFFVNGLAYQEIGDADIVFNDNVIFDTNENILNEDCNGGTDLLAVMTHEVGHLFGMGHSCENPQINEEPCNEPQASATMFWTASSCDPSSATLNEDDIEGINALYGPSVDFSCSHQVNDDLAVGVAPLEINCAISSLSADEITDVTWTWGDGTSSNEPLATHVYEEPGNYTLLLEVDGMRDACEDGSWEVSTRKVGFVQVCDVPQPAFLVEKLDGLDYQMFNETPIDVTGCLSNIEWQVFEGSEPNGNPVIDGISSWEPIITLPSDGTYTIVMNVGGIAGTDAAALTFDTGAALVAELDAANRGCSTLGGPGVFGSAIVAMGALLRRRRRT